MSDPTHDAPNRDRLGEPAAPTPPDPLEAVRSQTKSALPRRFYKQASFEKAEDGFRLTLDGRPARTPVRRVLAVPNAALAERLAREWAAQDEVVDPARMPLTRLVNSAIDGVAERREAVAEDLGRYAGTDLVAYRAGDPPRLVETQNAAWNPLLDWARDALGARLVLSEGVMHVGQPAETTAALRAVVDRVDSPFRLAALHAMTTLTGSLLIALAVLHGRLTPREAWAAAHVDEAFQSSVWGVDAEAEARLLARKAEFDAAAAVAELA